VIGLVGLGGVGDQLPVDDIGQSPAQAAQGLQRRLPLGQLALVVPAAGVSWRIWQTAAM
jgi:hypothetical protein